MSERDERVYLADMLAAARTLLRYTDGKSRADLEADELLRDAVLRQLEIFGEAASRVVEGTRLTSPEIPWRGIVGMRNTLIHAYHRVDLDVVWSAVSVELPRILPDIERLCAGAAASES